MKKLYRWVITLLCSLSLAVWTSAAVTVADSEKLGTELTPLGAEIEGNKEGTIPKWTGSVRGAPDWVTYKGTGYEYPDPYKDEKPLYVITHDNMAQYQDKLTAGLIALLNKYPETFKIPVYPTHRDFRYSEDIEARSKWNVGHAKLVNGVDGLQNFTGGVPFPLPEQGSEVIWNARMNQPMRVADSVFDEFGISPKGDRQWARQEYLIESPYSYVKQPVGKPVSEMGINSAYIFINNIEPKRKKGELVVVHEPVDQVTNPRKAWVYIPGAGRVKRAPTVGYDTPVGPGGIMTADDNYGFNGAMDRYHWKLLGKKELYVPYHQYRFDSASVSYSQLLPVKHVNPEYMRYELRRIWVVEATLKEGERHVYARRIFYVEEDSWLIVAADAYDDRGGLWRVGLCNTLYDYYLEGYLSRAQVNHDLEASSYVATRLVNETRPTNYAMEPKGEDFYSADGLRRMGRR